RGFIAQKTCDGKPYLRSGTARTAVPPVGMTILGSSAVPTYSSKSLREYSLRVRVRCLDRHLVQIVGTVLGMRHDGGAGKVKLQSHFAKSRAPHRPAQPGLLFRIKQQEAPAAGA